jgi:proline iminopeptidase
LHFAERYPDIVESICVYSVFLASRDDMEWMLRGSGLFYPDLLEEIYRQSEGINPYTHYAKMIFSEDLSAIQTAIKYMAHYERILGSVDAKFDDVRIDNEIIKSCRVALYYAANRYFMDNDEIIKNIDKIKDIPVIIVHNRLDMCCPVKGAWKLYRALNNAKIEIVADRGHSSKALKKAVRAHF